MPKATPLPLTSSVEIDAPPEEVWSVVSDVTRMPEWSPELRRLWFVGGRRGLGALLLGINRRGLVAWPTTSRVIRFEADRAVAWRTRESGATWTYELEPVGEGRTRLTSRRDLRGYGVATSLMGPVIGGAAGHDRELGEGLRSTLDRIKATVEAR